MDDAGQSPRELGEKFLKSLDKTRLGAAASKLFAASVGDIAILLSRSPAHKHYSLADIEWMVLPAVMAGQVYLVEAAHRTEGFRVPIGFISWAFVSEEVDRRLADQTAGRLRLRPDEWKSGEIAWLINAVGSREGVKRGLRWLRDGPRRDQRGKLIGEALNGRSQVQSLDDLSVAAEGAQE